MKDVTCRNLAAAGAVAVAARVVVPMVPGVFTKIPLNQAAGICGSALGQIGAAMNHTVAVRCGEVSDVMTALNLAAVPVSQRWPWPGSRGRGTAA